MGAFQEYVAELDSKIENLKIAKGNISELEILRLIYIDLGQKMNFDIHYTFGNKRQKKLIYNRIVCEEEFDRAIESREIICKSLAYMIDMILPRYGFKSTVVYECDEYGKIKCGAHVYNVIESLDGKRFIIDLEEDLEYIQTGAKTKYFAIDVHDESTCVYDDVEIRKIDQEIGYIPEGIYMEDILWMMDKAVSGNISDDELFEFVLDNLNKYRNITNMGYRDRILYYERMFEYFFNDKRLDFNGKPSIKRIEKYDCYKIIGGKRQYISCIITNFASEKIYLFDYEKNSYRKITIGEFAHMAQNGLEVPNSGRAKRLKRFNSKMCCEGPDL